MTEATETGTGTPFTPTGADEDLLYILSDTYECTRVWEAWQFGTMTEDDFQPAAETDLLSELIAWRNAAVAAERRRIVELAKAHRAHYPATFHGEDGYLSMSNKPFADVISDPGALSEPPLDEEKK